MKTNTTKKMIGLAALGIAALCVTPAEAGVSVHVSFGFPAYLPPPVVVVQPVPAPYPAPVAVWPAPCPAPVVIVEPRPVWQPAVWVPPGHREFYRHGHHGRWGHAAPGRHGHR